MNFKKSERPCFIQKPFNPQSYKSLAMILTMLLCLTRASDFVESAPVRKLKKTEAQLKQSRLFSKDMNPLFS